ncbi:MAG: transcription termination/antitermination protein NusG [Solirubrobacterales bacterium]
MNESPNTPMDEDAPDEEASAAATPEEEPVSGSAPEPEPAAEPEETLEDQVAQAVADAATQEAIADGAIAQALEESIVEDIEAAKAVEEASDAAIQEQYEERVAEAVATGLEGDELVDAVAQAAADADVQEAIADGAIAQALEETIAEDVEAAEAVEEASDAAIVEDLEARVDGIVADAAEPEAAEPEAEEAEPEPEPAEAEVEPTPEPEVEAAAAPPPAPVVEEELETTVRDPFKGPGDWYVVHTYAGYENKVKTNLESRIHTMQMEDKIFDVHIPMEDVMEIKSGKKQIVQRKVFPGYLLVKMIYDNDSWYVVRNTPGVTGFVAAGTGSKPTPLSRREVEKILAVKKEEVKPTFRLGFEEGDVVRIISGPFADFNGTISEINVDQSKLKVLVNIFDRETPVELGFDQVAKV